METDTLQYVKYVASDTGISARCSVATQRGAMRWEMGGGHSGGRGCVYTCG